MNMMLPLEFFRGGSSPSDSDDWKNVEAEGKVPEEGSPAMSTSEELQKEPLHFEEIQ